MGFLENIKAIPITDYAARSGYTVKRRGRYYTLAEHDSVTIDEDRNCFWRNSRFQKGLKGSAGSIIDFAIEFNGEVDVKAAMKSIAALYGIEGDKEAKVSYKKPVPQPKKAERRVGKVILPERDVNNYRVIAYLTKTRAIDRSVVNYFIKNNMLYQEAAHKNCVFHTKEIFACVRGTDSTKRFIGDLEGCDYDECFFIRPNEQANTLIVAESVIDIMSIMTQLAREGKRYTQFSYLAIAGTGKLPSLFIHLDKEPKFDEVILAFDNDEAGQKTTRIAEDGLLQKGFNGRCAVAVPTLGKDWNDYVKETRDSETAEKVFSKILDNIAGD